MPSLLTRTIVSLAVLVSQRAPLSRPRGINVYTRFYCFTIRVLLGLLTKKRAKVRKKLHICKFLWIFFVLYEKKKGKRSFDSIRTLCDFHEIIPIITY